MMRWWLGLFVLAFVLTGCAQPRSEPMMEPVMVPAPETGTSGMVEPVMEPSVVEAKPHRPRCKPGDDGIGGTGCKVD